MGNISDKQILKKYWNNSRRGMTISRDNREIKRCFEAYDKNKSGALELEEAIKYIKDILLISGLDVKIKADAQGLDSQDPEVYFEHVVLTIYHEMDPNDKGSINFEDLLKPKINLWQDFLRFISVQTLHQMNEDVKDSKDSKVHSKKYAKKGKKSVKKQEEDEDQFSDKENFEIEDEYDEESEKISKEITKVGISNVRNLKSSHKAVDHDGILKLRESNVQSVVEFLGISQNQAQSLLSAFRWDKEKLLEVYIDDPEKACLAAKLTFPLPVISNVEIQSSNIETENEIECSICLNDCIEFTRLPVCGHVFCNDCWRAQFENDIKEGKTFNINCMQQGCQELVPDNIVQKLVSTELWSKYVTFLAKNFVESSTQITWCPAPDCGRAIVDRIYEGTSVIGKCSCGYMFCYKCKEEAHTPCTCEEYSEWKEKGSKDLGSAKWILDNTKPCPKCKTFIEKNDGCFMMTCTQCHHQFCWLCSSDWSTHGDHFKCSKFNSTSLSNKAEWLDDKKPLEIGALPTEYIHYMDRYMQWAHSFDQTDKLWDSLEIQIQNLSSLNIDPAFLIKAFKQLKENRRMIKYICIHICLNKNQTQKQLDQIYLDSLEMVTEKLGRSLQSPETNQIQIKKLSKIGKNAVKQLLSK